MAQLSKGGEEKERQEAKARAEEAIKEKEAEDAFKANLRKIWPEAAATSRMDLSPQVAPA